MRILLTGSQGRVGSFLTAHLPAPDLELVALDRREHAGPGRVCADLLDPSACAAAVRGIDAVLHFAGGGEFPDVHRGNLDATRNLARAAAAAGVRRFLFASTINVQGAGLFAAHNYLTPPATLPIDELSPAQGRDPYSRSKLDGEAELRALTASTPLSAYCFRLPGIWSPAAAYAYEPRGIPELAPTCLIDPWHYLDMRDLLAAVRLYVNNAVVPRFGVAYLVAADTSRPEPTAWLFERSLPGWLSRFASPPIGHTPWFSSARVEQDLGWKPVHSWRTAGVAPVEPATPEPPPPPLWNPLRIARGVQRRVLRAFERLGVLLGRGRLVPAQPGFERLARDPAVERVRGGLRFTEGPLWEPADASLCFSDIPADILYRLAENGELTPRRAPSRNSNGLTRDARGRLIACEGVARRVTREEPDGALTVLASHFDGRRLNSPNDVVTHSSGRVYFTDPPYAIPLELQEQPVQGVYCVDPDGALRCVARDFKRPNGLAFSRDESTLFVADSALYHIRALPVAADGSLGEGRVFAILHAVADGCPDGMKLDGDGRLLCAGPCGVWGFAPDGQHLGTIRLPELPANLAWGGARGDDLYITARTSIYRVRWAVPGAVFPAGKP